MRPCITGILLVGALGIGCGQTLWGPCGHGVCQGVLDDGGCGYFAPECDCLNQEENTSDQLCHLANPLTGYTFVTGAPPAGCVNVVPHWGCD